MHALPDGFVSPRIQYFSEVKICLEMRNRNVEVTDADGDVTWESDTCSCWVGIISVPSHLAADPNYQVSGSDLPPQFVYPNMGLSPPTWKRGDFFVHGGCYLTSVKASKYQSRTVYVPVNHADQSAQSALQLLFNLSSIFLCYISLSFP